ncbi:MAG: hypothetical protein ACYS7Y_26300 [Planctomycetota bacterium]|jgi:hypothetical protein
MMSGDSMYELSKEQKARFRELKKQKNKWWKEEVVRSAGNKWDIFEPRTPGQKKTNAYCVTRDSYYVEVEVWINHRNFKMIEPSDGTAAGRVWPTKEGALLSILEKHTSKRKKLREELTDTEYRIASINEELFVSGL